MSGLIGGATKSLTGTFKTLLGDNPKAPDAPEPVVMPDADDEAIAQAKRRKTAEIAARGGRQSTILSGSDDKLGG